MADIATDLKDAKAAIRATVAWAGTNPTVSERNELLRLFKRTWDNPRPEVAVETMDFTSTGTECAPFLIVPTPRVDFNRLSRAESKSSSRSLPE